MAPRCTLNYRSGTVVPTSYAKTLKGDITGGVLSAVIALPISIVSGLLAFSPLGPDYMSAGVLAGLVGAILVSLITTLFGGSPIQISGPRSSLAMVMAAVLVGLDETLSLSQNIPNRELILLAMMFLCLLLAGTFQLLFGFLKLGSLIKFAPQSVISGLVNGFAVLIISRQLPVAFGLTQLSDVADVIIGQTQAHGLPIIVAGVSILVSLAAKRYFTALPGTLLGLLCGMVVYHLFAPTGGNGADLIGAIPHISAEIPGHLSIWLNGLSTDTQTLPLVFNLISSALALAFLGSAFSLLSLSAVESLSHKRCDGNQELIGQGLANMVSGAFGGLAGGGSSLRSITNYRSGGRSRVSGLVHALFIIAILLGLSPVIEIIPLAAIAGVLIVIAIQMIDKETLRQALSLILGRSENAADYIIPNVVVTFLVMILTVTMGFVLAAGVGVVVASLMFSARMGKIVVRSRHQGDGFRSKTARPYDAIQALESSKNAITVFEAQGPIFFGSADQLAQEIESALDGTEIVILDLRRVTAIDDTGLKIFQRLDRALSDQGILFFLSHLHEESPLWSSINTQMNNWQLQIFIDTDIALSHAEDVLLENRLEGGHWNLQVPLSKIDILHGLDNEQADYLNNNFDLRRYGQGEHILRQGEHTTEMYLLSEGTVSVMMNVTGSHRMVRLSGLRPGVTFGEMSLINDASRSTSIIADEPVTCFVLSRDAFLKIANERADIVTILLMNMLREMSSRLRVTSEQVGELEQ